MNRPNLTRPELVGSAREISRLWSVRAAAALLVLSLVEGVLHQLQADVLPALQPLLPPGVWPWLSAGFAGAIIVLRAIRQAGALLGVPPAQPSEAAERPAPDNGGPQ